MPNQTVAELKKQFASFPALTFEEKGGLVCVHVTTAEATATVFLQGAHLTAWQPAGEKPVIFTTQRADALAPGKPIRGGIPVVFPWFATDKKQDRINGKPGPSHGFARTEVWTLTKAEHVGKDVALTFFLQANDVSRSMGFDAFHMQLTFTIGRTLTLSVFVHNPADKPLTFEQAFHSYFRVTDIHEAAVRGLEPTPFIDKTDDFKVKPAAGKPVVFHAKVDSVYLDTAATCTISDEVAHRNIKIAKTGSHSTIVFNPYADMPDLAPWEYHGFVAVETANVDRNAITLAPDEAHTMTATISVSR